MRSSPDTATLSLKVNRADTKRMLEGLEDAIVTDLSMEHSRLDGTVTASMELEARSMTMTASDSDESGGEPPVYDSTVNWDSGRVDTDEWDVGTDAAESVYERLITEVSKATKAGDPDVVVVGVPQYRALWVYVEEIHDTADNPESLVPLRMVVVPGPQLHVERRNLDVLYGNY